MTPDEKAKIIEYVENNIDQFHQQKLEKLKSLNLQKVLARKNPYLYKAKNQNLAASIVSDIVNAYISSSEETLFGAWLEGLAIYVAGMFYSGRKSSAEGIDLELNKNGCHYLVSIKSGPNWGNSSQIKKMREDFKKAEKILKTNRTGTEICAVNGCCYGRDNAPDKGDYLKLCGQNFWEFLSGDPSLYLEIIEPIGVKAKEKNESYQKALDSKMNSLTKVFLSEFCHSGEIDWNKLVRLSSQAKQP